MKSTKLFDVVAVDLVTRRVRLMGEGKTLDNAEAVVKLAVMRRGVEDAFFVAVATQTYKEGDTWEGKG